MLFKIPAACLLLILYSFAIYKRSKRLPTRAARIFEYMLICMVVNLTTDTLTQYSVNHRELVPAALNYIWHVCFLESILSMCFMMYYYLQTYVERGTGIRRDQEKKVTMIVWVVGAFAVLILPISYIDSPYGSYSMGAKVIALHIGVVYTMSLMLYNLVRYWKWISKSKREIMMSSVVIYIAFGLFQIAFPYFLLTGLGLTLIVLGILLTAEDGKQYIDGRIGLFNELGFREVLAEQIFREAPFWITAYVYTCPKEETGEAEEMVQRVSEYMKEYLNLPGYFFPCNMVVFLNPCIFRKEKEEKRLPHFAPQEGKLKEYSRVFLYEAGESAEDVLRRLYSFAEEYTEEAAYKDVMTGVYNRNAYEYDIPAFLKKDRSAWYVVVDINRLKDANDTYGHSFGDELIQTVAHLLEDTFKHDSRVYRVGGDEFAVLYVGVSIEPMLRNLEKARRACNANRSTPVEFALGYAFYDPKKSEWKETAKKADQNMYEDKLKSGGGR